MYKYILIYLCFICSCFQVWGQEHQWNEPFFINMNLGGALSSDMRVDNVGNTYLTAIFKDQVEIKDTVLYSSLKYGVFIAKFDINHNLIWSKVIAEAKEFSPNFSRVLSSVSLNIDDLDNIYSTILYEDSTYINNQLFTVEQSETYYQDIAILKISSVGQIDNVFNIKGSCQTGVGGIEIVQSNLYFHLGVNRNTLDTDSTCSCIIADTTINFEESRGLYGKLTLSNNNIDWIKNYSATGSTIGAGEIVVNDSKIYLTGGILWPSDLVFDDGVLNVPSIYSKYGYFIQLDLQGNLQWTRYFAVKGFDSYSIPRTLEANSKNDMVVVINLLTQSVPNQVFFENAPTLTGATNNDESFVIVNYDSLGNVKWHDISNSLGYERMISVDFDSHKNMYLAGSFTTDITFGSQFIDGYGSSNDILVISYDSLGNKRWAQKAGGTGSDLGAYMSIDSFDNLHVGGFITGASVNFGAYETNPPSPGNSIFVAQMRLEPIGLEETTPQQFGVSLYPNPSLGNTHVEIQDEFISQIRVYNALGQEVQTLNFKNQTSQASIENLVSGYYIIDIHSLSGKRVSQKLIVK